MHDYIDITFDSSKKILYDDSKMIREYLTNTTPLNIRDLEVSSPCVLRYDERERIETATIFT